MMDHYLELIITKNLFVPSTDVLGGRVQGQDILL